MSQSDDVVCLYCGTPKLSGVCPRCGSVESTAGLHHASAAEIAPDSEAEEDTAPHVLGNDVLGNDAGPELNDLPPPAPERPALQEKGKLIPSTTVRPARSAAGGTAAPIHVPHEHFTRGHGDIRSEPIGDEPPASFPSRKPAPLPSPPPAPHVPFDSRLAHAELEVEPPRPKVGQIDSNRFAELMPTDEKFSLLQQPEPDDNLTDSILPDSILGIPTTPKGLLTLLAIFLGVILAGGWLLTNARSLFPPPKDEVKLPRALHEKPSPQRPALVAAIDRMDEFASHAESVLLDDHESSTATLQSLVSQLGDIDHFIAGLKPGLNAEEVRVAAAMTNPSTQLRAFIDSYNTRLPDLDGTYAKVAREQIEEARILLTGKRSPTPLRGQAQP